MTGSARTEHSWCSARHVDHDISHDCSGFLCLVRGSCLVKRKARADIMLQKPGAEHRIEVGQCLCAYLRRQNVHVRRLERHGLVSLEKYVNRTPLGRLAEGKDIAEVLAMTVEEALEFFRHILPLKRRLQLLADVELGYIELGQPAPTLSGGEAQRVKLARELGKRDTGRTVYILDEPTTGLHFAEIQRLLEVLNRLVDAGNTVIVIEHNLDVVKSADYIIDLGPEGGDQGGEIIAHGTPEEVAAMPHSYTGEFLKQVLSAGK